MRPSGERVPSTNVVMCVPLASTRCASATLRCASARLPVRSTAMNSPWRKPVPRMGKFISDRFMKAEVRPGLSEIGNVVRHKDAGAIAGDPLQALSAQAHAGDAAAGREHEARGFVERQNVAREPAPRNEEQGRRNAPD